MKILIYTYILNIDTVELLEREFTDQQSISELGLDVWVWR